LILVTIAAWAQNSSGTKPVREDLTIDPATIMEPWTGDLDQMVERRIVRVLVVPNKTFYFNDNGTQRGATHDAFRLMERELNARLRREKKLDRKNLTVTFFFVPVRRDDILPALVAGRGDIAAAELTITPQRQQLVDFATPHTTSVHQVVVAGPAAPTLTTIDDLAGKEVFVRKSSSYYESLVDLNKRFAAEKRPLVQVQDAAEELEDEDLVEMANAGLVGMVVLDKYIADFWKKVFPKIKIYDTIPLRTGDNIAWALRKNSPQLKAALDQAVVSFTTGKYAASRQQILARYLQRLTYVKNAASDAERKKFLALMDVFRKYGDRYDVDSLLMAAQGYQESALNQEARSPVGAIGVMQVMPATGKDMNVGDITRTDPNIHAGVKYMRFMIDQFFEREPMTKLDKALFAFASYNAGPGRVAQLRKEAARRGLDQNVWFHNVEYIAAEKIGRETVTYVSNIYKYYVAYSLIQQSLDARAAARKKG
jgi:membrane-bound lytic murein transglycosylase MltF